MKVEKVILLVSILLLAAKVSTADDDDNKDAAAGDIPDPNVPTVDEDGVMVLTKNNFQAIILHTDTVLVEFYAPWCGHCKQLAPEYAAAAQELKTLVPPVVLAKVDATVETDLAKKYEVSSYPTLKYFKVGKDYTYDGPRTQSGIIDYMKKIANPAWKPEPDAVVVLTKENFTEITDREELMLVEFYAPWCGHCKALAPKYEKAAKKLKEGPEPIILAKVDATVETDLASKYEVSGYPTLKVFRKGRAYEYKGERNEWGLVDYMNKQRGEPAKPVSVAALKHFLQIDDISILAFFESEDDPRLRIYQDSVQDMRTDYYVGYTTDKQLFAMYKANPGNVLVINAERFNTKFEPKWHVFTITEKTDPSEVSKFIIAHQFPLVGQYDGKLRSRYEESAGPFCIFFYTVDWSFEHRDATQMWRQKIAEIANHYKDIRFVIANDSNEELLKMFGLEDSNMEINVAILDGKKKYGMNLMDEYDEDHVRDFINRFKKGKLTPYIKSQPVPKKQPGPMKVVVGKTFEQIVLDKSKDVLIEMYAPWCGHCKQLEPIYKDLAKKMKPVKDLVIAKLDATANDVPENYAANGFPTIYFAPRNSKEHPIHYTENREIDHFIKFLKEKATVSLSAVKDEL